MTSIRKLTSLPVLVALSSPALALGASGGQPSVRVTGLECPWVNGAPVLIGHFALTKPGDSLTDYIDFDAQPVTVPEPPALQVWTNVFNRWTVYRTVNAPRRKLTVSHTNMRWNGDQTWDGQRFRISYAARWRQYRLYPITHKPMGDRHSKTIYPIPHSKVDQKGWFYSTASREVTCTDPTTPRQRPADTAPDQSAPTDMPAPQEPNNPPSGDTKVCPDGTVTLFILPCIIATPPSPA